MKKKKGTNGNQHRAMAERLQGQKANVISVCDREADIYEYLQYKLTEQQRLIVRSMQSRHIDEGENKLYAFAMRAGECRYQTTSYCAKRRNKIP